MMIICIIGKARHGKDTAGDIIKNVVEHKYNLPTIKLALADPLKEEALKYLGLGTIEELDYYKNENIPVKGINVRELLTQLGDSHTNNSPFYYCNLAMSEIHMHSSNTVSIITDVRMKKEWEYFKKLNNVIFIKVVRNIKDVNTKNHKTETESFDLVGDYNIINNTLETYKSDVTELITIIMDKYTDNKKMILDRHIPEEVYSVFNRSSYL